MRCRRVASICLGIPGSLEAQCRRRDVEVFASRDREIGRCDVGLQTWRYGGSEVWRCAAGVLPLCLLRRCDVGVQTWRYGGSEVWGRAVGVAIWRCGALEARLQALPHGDMVVWNSRDALQV